MKYLILLAMVVVMGCQPTNQETNSAFDVSEFVNRYVTSRTDTLARTEEPESFSIEHSIVYQDTINDFYIINFAETTRIINHKNYVIVIGAGVFHNDNYDALYDVNAALQSLSSPDYELYYGVAENLNSDFTGDGIPEFLINGVMTFHTDMQGEKSIYALVRGDSSHMKQLITFPVDVVGRGCDGIVGTWVDLAVDNKDGVLTLMVKSTYGAVDGDGCEGYIAKNSVARYRWDAKHPQFVTAGEKDFIEALVTKTPVSFPYGHLGIDKPDNPDYPLIINEIKPWGDYYIMALSEEGEYGKSFLIWVYSSTGIKTSEAQISEAFVDDGDVFDGDYVFEKDNLIRVTLTHRFYTDGITRSHITYYKIGNDGKVNRVLWNDDRSSLSSLPKDVLTLIRNEIFAQHGLRFEDEELKHYFTGYSWYHGTKDNVDTELSAEEKEFVAMLKELEDKTPE